MFRKVITLFFVLLVLCCGFSATAHAVDYTAYDGNISSTYTSYFRDILTNCSINDNYVYFRDSQNGYTMVVGKLDYINNSFVLLEKGMIYHIDNNGTNYNTHYVYSVEEIDVFHLDTDNKIVYSDLGNFPQLEERGDRFEVLQTITIVCIGLSFVVHSIFTNRNRRLHE